MATPMSCRILVENTDDMSREEWLRYRKMGIGGSDASTILGQNPWSTARELWQTKTDDEIPEDLSDNEAIYWGNVLEDIVAREFARRKDMTIRKRNAILQHPEHDWMLANIDRNCIDEEQGWGILECKTTNAYMGSAWEDGVPPFVRSQLLHYLAVTGLDYGYVAVLLGGQQYKYFRIDRDEETIQTMINVEKKFWERVENGNPPPIDGSTAAADWLKKHFPKSNKEETKLSKEALTWIAEYQEAHEQVKEAKQRKTLAGNKLKDMLGDFEQGIVEDHVVKWSDYSRTYFDKKQFEEEHPELYEKYTDQRSYRRFAIK